MPLIGADVVGAAIGAEKAVVVVQGGGDGAAGVNRRTAEQFVVVAHARRIVIRKERRGGDRVRALAAGGHQVPIARAVPVHQVVGILGVDDPTGRILLNPVAVRVGGSAVVVHDVVVDHRVAVRARKGALRVAADHDAAVEVVENGIVGEGIVGRAVPQL